MDWDALEKLASRKIDIQATRRRIERLVKLYFNYKTIIATRGSQSITVSYKPTTGTSGTMYNSSMDKVTEFNLENEYSGFVEMFERAIETLDGEEREAFISFYIKQKSGIACYVDMGIAESMFRKIKNKAIEHFAIALGCEVYHD